LVISESSLLKLYQINNNIFQLNTKIEFDYFYSDYCVENKLLNYGNNYIALTINNNSPTTCHGPLNSLYFFENKTMKKLLCNRLHSSHHSDSVFFYKKKVYLTRFSSFITIVMMRKNNGAVYENSTFSVKADKFIKLNENEICTYYKRNEEASFLVYEFE
jgi:hypothetical protein